MTRLILLVSLGLISYCLAGSDEAVGRKCVQDFFKSYNFTDDAIPSFQKFIEPLIKNYDKSGAAAFKSDCGKFGTLRTCIKSCKSCQTSAYIPQTFGATNEDDSLQYTSLYNLSDYVCNAGAPAIAKNYQCLFKQLKEPSADTAACMKTFHTSKDPMTNCDAQIGFSTCIQKSLSKGCGTEAVPVACNVLRIVSLSIPLTKCENKFPKC
uniref:ShKT domain-containing protein n=1 Tax=Rhabditophanes sp. KR3021 TaxID=114890 RepID=A0AC35UDS1_9BILA